MKPLPAISRHCRSCVYSFLLSVQENKSTFKSSARTKESRDANIHAKSVLAHTLMLRQAGQFFRLSSVSCLKLPANGVCFDYPKMSDYMEYDRGRPPTSHPSNHTGTNRRVCKEWALPLAQSTEFWVVSFSIPSGLDGMKENKRGEKLLRQEI